MAETNKKRVVYFVPEFPRISETFIERELAKLIDLDHLAITILALSKASGSTSSAVLAHTVYNRLSPADVVYGLAYLLTRPRQAYYCLKLALELPKQSLWARVYFFSKTLGYTHILAGLKPQHIHAHFLAWPSTTVLMAAHLLGIPFSISAHARDVFVEGELVTHKIKTAKFISICNSYAYTKAVELAGATVDSSRIKLIYHGLDPQMFDSPPTTPRLTESATCPALFLGGTRLVEKKGLKYMIEASRLLRDRGIVHRVDLVGPGDLYVTLGNLIADLKLQDTVFIHGGGKGTPFKEVLDYYKKADLFVFPAIETGSGDVDGVPTVVIEAAMAKLPIITTAAGGITDLIEDGVTGIIIAQKDPEAIANSVERLLADKGLAANLAQTAYAKAVTMFDLAKNIGQLESLLV
jgi:glycosyltransferase involved in cell wall biosynthesis